MKKITLLVDYENTQPDFRRIDPALYEVKVFLSRHKSKIKGTWPECLTLEAIQTKAAGKNALDFHLVLALGKELALHPDRQYIIVSKDKGFDTLCDGAPNVQRMAEVPGSSTALLDSDVVFSSWLDWLRTKLRQQSKNTPQTLSALFNYFLPQLQKAVRKKQVVGPQDVGSSFQAFIERLAQKGLIQKQGTGVKISLLLA